MEEESKRRKLTTKEIEEKLNMVEKELDKPKKKKKEKYAKLNKRQFNLLKNKFDLCQHEWFDTNTHLDTIEYRTGLILFLLSALIIGMIVIGIINGIADSLNKKEEPVTYTTRSRSAVYYIDTTDKSRPMLVIKMKYTCNDIPTEYAINISDIVTDIFNARTEDGLSAKVLPIYMDKSNEGEETDESSEQENENGN